MVPEPSMQAMDPGFNFGFLPALKSAATLAASGRNLPPGGSGYIAGELPNGLVTYNSLPAVRIIDVFDRATNICVATTVSTSSGTYRVDGLSLTRLYDVRARGASSSENDLIMSQVYAHPSTLTLTGTFPTAADTTSTYSGALVISGGVPPYSNPRVTSGSLPAGLSLAIVGNILTLTGTPTASGVTSPFTAAVDSTDSQTATSVQSVQVFTDPYGTKVALLMHFDGANGSNTFTDSSGLNTFAIQAGTPTITTATSKYGGASGNFPVNTNAAIFTIDKPALQFGTGDFTVEGWFLPQAGTGAYGAFFEKGINTATGLTLTVLPTAVGFRYNGTTTVSQTITSISAWTHIAFVRVAGVMNIYVGGTSVYSSAITLNHSDNDSLYIGSNSNAGSGTFSYGGGIDDLRISKGIARYTSNFTPPTAAFVL